MRILKKPDHIIFDTDNPDRMIFQTKTEFPHTPLHWINQSGDWDFLNQHFHPKDGVQHPIFSNFDRSFYFMIDINPKEVETTQTKTQF